MSLFPTCVSSYYYMLYSSSWVEIDMVVVHSLSSTFELRSLINMELKSFSSSVTISWLILCLVFGDILYCICWSIRSLFLFISANALPYISFHIYIACFVIIYSFNITGTSSQIMLHSVWPSSFLCLFHVPYLVSLL